MDSLEFFNLTSQPLLVIPALHYGLQCQQRDDIFGLSSDQGGTDRSGA
jgi:hypothetical protein